MIPKAFVVLRISYDQEERAQVGHKKHLSFYASRMMIRRRERRLVEGVEMLARILHPDLVTKRCPDKTVLKLALHSNQRCRQKLLANYFLPYS